jgi:hypothetical protein
MFSNSRQMAQSVTVGPDLGFQRAPNAENVRKGRPRRRARGPAVDEGVDWAGIG